MIRRVLHARDHNAPLTQPLARYFQDNKWHNITSASITGLLQIAVVALGEANLGFTRHDISARSLRAAGAMALLCAQVDRDIIQLLGQWRSDEMLRYLHVQAEPVMRHFSRMMITDGDFVLHPNQAVPSL